MGTMILTITGLVSRVIGFFYRIYLSRLFGEEGMGIYQLINPVLALTFSLTAAGYQTAISKFVAEYSASERSAKEKNRLLLPLFTGLSISLPLSFFCTGFLFCFSDFIAAHFLLEPRTAPMLRILSFSLPMGAVHSCINGYFYGIKKTAVPAASQLVEQLARVACVYCVSFRMISLGKSPSINVAVLGLAAGEFISMLLSVFSVWLIYAGRSSAKNSSISGNPSSGNLSPGSLCSGSLCPNRLSSSLLPVYRSILSMALPLTANRIVLTLLHSIESVSLPAKLKLYGYDTATSLSVYGVLTGMAMPLIFFPNALTNSVSVLLLPVISENYALGNFKAVREATRKTVKYCFLMGFACMLCFLFFGKWAGTALFDSDLAGYFITTLSFICPFIYLDTTLSSILQGLGMAGRIFIINVLCQLLRLAFVFGAVPHFGITGYLWGMLAGQLLTSLLYLGCLSVHLKSCRTFRHKKQGAAP